LGTAAVLSEGLIPITETAVCGMPVLCQLVSCVCNSGDSIVSFSRSDESEVLGWLLTELSSKVFVMFLEKKCIPMSTNSIDFLNFGMNDCIADEQTDKYSCKYLLVLFHISFYLILLFTV
jgi:hypothetical protein